MKRLFLVIVALLCVLSALPATAQYETEFTLIVPRVSVAISGDTDLNLQEVGITNQPLLKRVSVVTALTPTLRIGYWGILPIKEDGRGQLNQQIVLNGIVYGPKDANDTKAKDITTQYNFSDHRVEVDFFPIINNYPTSQMYFVGSLEFQLASVTIKGVPQSSGSGSTSGNDPIEATVNSNRMLIGAGIGGFQRQRNILFKYRIVYDFLNQGRGWLATADLRYEVDQRGYAGIGYLYQDLNTPFDNVRLKQRFSGGVFQVGVLF